jgi:hypothetical protein
MWEEKDDLFVEEIHEHSSQDFTSAEFPTVFRIRIGSGFNKVSGSGSRRAKLAHKNRKKLRNFMIGNAFF